MRYQYKIKNIETFIRIAESLSFSRAAESLGMSTSGVSKALNELENSLGCRLLQRTTRTVRLTSEGSTFYIHANRWLTDFEEMLSSHYNTTASLQGSIRIEMPVTYGRILFVPILSDFIRLYPKLTVDVRTKDTYSNLIADGIDVAIRFGNLENSELISRLLDRVTFGTYAHSRYLEQFGVPQHPRDLLSHRLIASVNSTGKRSKFIYQKNEEHYQIEPDNAIAVFNNGDLLTDAIINGMGIAQVATFKIKHAIEQGDIKQILHGWDYLEIPIQLVYPSRRYIPHRVSVLIEFLMEKLGNKLLNSS